MVLGTVYAHIHLASAFSLQNRDSEARTELLEALRLAMPDRILIPFAENGIYLRKTMDKVRKDGLYCEELDRIFQLMDQIEGSAEKILREKFGVIPDYGLTEREMEVAKLAADCMPTTEIARQLELSPNTVKNHLKHVFDKMGIMGTDRNKREKLGEKLKMM